MITLVAAAHFAAEHPVRQRRVGKNDWHDDHRTHEQENLARARCRGSPDAQARRHDVGKDADQQVNAERRQRQIAGEIAGLGLCLPEAWSNARPAAALPGADATATPASSTAPTRPGSARPEPRPSPARSAPHSSSGTVPCSTTPSAFASSSATSRRSQPKPSSKPKDGQERKATAPATSATAKTPLQITRPRRSPGPAAVTAKTP